VDRIRPPGGRQRVLLRRLLGTEARYRVLRRSGATVEVEVLAAPGLRPGQRLRISASELRSRRRGGQLVRLACNLTRLALARIPPVKLPLSI
jgi:hypothetical protein